MMAREINLGVGQYQIGGNPAENPPRVHFYSCQHDMPTGADVPPSDKAADPEVTLVFHNRESVDAMIRALTITRSWFDPPRTLDVRVVT